MKDSISKFNVGVDFGILYGKDELLQSCVLVALRNAVGHSNRISRGSLVARVREIWAMYQGGNRMPGERRIRNAIRDLRRNGALIMSTGGKKGGYWKAVSLDEVRAFCEAELEARAKDLFYTASQLEAAAIGSFGRQARLGLPEVMSLDEIPLFMSGKGVMYDEEY